MISPRHNEGIGRPQWTIRLLAQPVRFGSFELDLRAGELRKQGAKIKLQGNPQILAMLLEQPGQVVTRRNYAADSGLPIPLLISITV